MYSKNLPERFNYFSLKHHLGKLKIMPSLIDGMRSKKRHVNHGKSELFSDHGTQGQQRFSVNEHRNHESLKLKG